MAPCSETPNCVAYSNTLREANQERHEAAFAGKTSTSWKRGENELHPHRDSKVYRARVRGGSTGPNLLCYIAIGETRCAGCLCTSSGWFKHIEPLLNLLELPNLRCARCNMHRFGEVQAHRTSSNLFYTCDKKIHIKMKNS